jgi:hypothetical protein
MVARLVVKFVGSGRSLHLAGHAGDTSRDRTLTLREHYWSNREYRDIGALEVAAECAWRAVCLDPAKIRTVCRCGYVNTGS